MLPPAARLNIEVPSALPQAIASGAVIEPRRSNKVSARMYRRPMCADRVPESPRSIVGCEGAMGHGGVITEKFSTMGAV